MMATNAKRLNDAERVWVSPETGEVINVDRAWQASDKRIAISRRQSALLAAAGMDGPEARWYVLQLRRGADIVVDNSLKEANIERWMPSKLVEQKHRGGRKGPKPEAKLVPFLPGYLFVKVVWCAPCWEALTGIKGVVDVIGSAERPAPVVEDRLLKLRAFIEKDPAAVETLTNALKAGDRVAIDAGPFASYWGVVDQVFKNGRALIDVMIFGRSTSVDVDIAQVRKSEYPSRPRTSRKSRTLF